MECPLQCDHNVRFDISSAFRRRLPAAEPAESRAATTAAEERLEEIAKPGSAKLELDSSAIAAPLIKSTSGLVRLPLPPGRRLEPARPVPIRPELVVFLPLLWVAQYLVGFINLLKFFFRRLFILGDIGMIFPRQLAKRATDFVLGGRFRDTERFV